ncbi:hypothetical protein QYF50_06235 [Paenibacillus vini]|uniref:hypothetical protein n=1 Tax=Paenibacillus vini TaxID=1476024 RepID=UPI0025B6B2BD|nr:hypothetical protein [Paenibacillus vini]MDN4067489.1 hypothetical protein [Paenibacillus vini]
MKVKWILQSLLVTLGIVLLLSVVTRAGGPVFEHSRPVSAAVFEPGKPVELNDGNLVDGLSAIELPVPIAKVDLNGSVLSVDLKVTEERFDKGELYRGIAELISFSFERTSNIDQLLLRLVAEDRWLGTRYLLLAADVRRGEWSDSAMNELRNAGDHELPKELRTLFRMTETHLWKRGVN